MPMVRVGVTEQFKLAAKESGFSSNIARVTAIVEDNPVKAQSGFNDLVNMARRFAKLENLEMAIVRKVEEEMSDDAQHSAVVAKVAMLHQENAVVAAVDSINLGREIHFYRGRQKLIELLEGKVVVDVREAGALLAEKVLESALQTRGLHELTKDEDWAAPIASAMMGLDAARAALHRERQFISWTVGEVDSLVQITHRRAEIYTNSTIEVEKKLAL